MSSERRTDGILRAALILILIILLVPMLIMAFMMPFMGMWGGGMMWNHGFGVSPWWGVGMMLFWLVLLVGGGYIAYRWLSGSQAISDPALEELRVAYARGDLTEEEFEERRRKLMEE